MPLNIDWQQILLHLLNFAILCGGLYLLLYKPVKNFMAKRLAQYEAREAETRQRETDADAMKEKYQSMLRQAEQEILARREKVGEELEEEKRQQLAEARAEARKILSTAAKTAELRTKKALEDSHEEIRALAIGMVERMVVENSGDALDQFLSEAEAGIAKPVKGASESEASKASAPEAETARASAAKAETAKASAVKTETAKASAVKTEAARASAAKTETAKASAPEAETAKASAAKEEAAPAPEAEAVKPKARKSPARSRAKADGGSRAADKSQERGARRG